MLGWTVSAPTVPTMPRPASRASRSTRRTSSAAEASASFRAAMGVPPAWSCRPRIVTRNRLGAAIAVTTPTGRPARSRVADCSMWSSRYRAMLPGSRRASPRRAARPPTVSIASPRVLPWLSRSAATVSASIRPLMARLPIVESPKSDGSSQVKFTTSRGRPSRCPAAWRHRATSSPARTPAIPSNRPPACTVSRCEPVMIDGPSCRPGRRPITLAAASTVTSSPAARISAATQARAARSSSEKARRV